MKIQIEKYRQKKRHREVIVGVQYSPTGRFLASADQSGEIIVWPGGHLRGARRVCSPYSLLTGIWFSEDEEFLMAGHQGGCLLVYALPEFELAAEIVLKTDHTNGPKVQKGASGPLLNRVLLAVWPSNALNLYAILEFNDFFTIRREDFQITNHIHLSGPLIECTAGSPHGRLLFLGDELGYISRLWLPEMKLENFARHCEEVQASDLTPEAAKTEDTPGIAALALSRNGKLIVSTSREGGVQIWHAQAERKEDSSWREFRPLVVRAPLQTGWIRGVCFLPNSTYLVLGGDKGTVEVWNFKSGKATEMLKCPSGVRCLDASRDGSQLAVGCEDGSIFLIPWAQSII